MSKNTILEEIVDGISIEKAKEIDARAFSFLDKLDIDDYRMFRAIIDKIIIEQLKVT